MADATAERTGSTTVWRLAGWAWRLSALAGLVLALALVVGCACCIIFSYMTSGGYPPIEREWHAALRLAQIEVIVVAAVVLLCWFGMIGSGRGWAELWGVGVGLAWGTCFLPIGTTLSVVYMSGFDCHLHAQFFWDELPTYATLFGSPVFLSVAASQVWVAWKAHELSQDRTLPPLNS